MVVSTIYDKDLGEKVFQIRDSERYTNSTQTYLEISYENDNRSYVTVDFTISVHKHLGKSSVVVYCDNEVVAIAPISQSQSSVTTSANVEYGNHKYYAKYMGNAECLSSRSGITELEVTEPDLIKTRFDVSIAEIDANNWVGNIKTIEPLVVLMDKDNNTILADKTITITVPEHLDAVEKVTTASELNISDLFNTDDWNGFVGDVDLKIVFEGDDECLGSDIELKFYAGYDFTVTPTYPKIGLGDTTPLTATLSKPNGNAIEGAEIEFNEED